MKAIEAAFLLFGVTAASAPASAQHIIGGGDPLMMIFSEAQFEAARILEGLDPATMPFGSQAVTAWLSLVQPYRGTLMPRHEAMALEMTRSTHSWKEGDVGFNKCAVIPLDPAVEPVINLSLTNCRPLLIFSTSGGAEALKTLVHEIGHRFGLTTSDRDEAFATEVAVAVYKSWRAARRSAEPYWLGLGDGGFLSERFQPSAVWTGSGLRASSNQLLVWGGCNENPVPSSSICTNYLNSGARIELQPGQGDDVPRSRWMPISSVDAPIGRKLHSAVWTGETKLPEARRKMIVFGGCRGDDTACDQSFAVTPHSIYDADADQWKPLATSGAPSARVFHGAVWTTHDEMIVWGGLENYQRPTVDRILGDGGILSFPEGKPEGEWRALPLEGAPSARYGHTAIWTGTELLVFGGCGQEPGATRCVKPLNDGGTFDPYPAEGVAHWRPLPVDRAVTPRTSHSSIWTGRYLIVWGGLDEAGHVIPGGARYDAVEKTWKTLNPTLPNGELGRRDHVAVYEPLQGRMIIWGGVAADRSYPTRTLVYDIENDTWSYAGTATDPTGREGHVAAWIQDSLVVWGGFRKTQGCLAGGGIFNP